MGSFLVNTSCQYCGLFLFIRIVLIQAEQMVSWRVTYLLVVRSSVCMPFLTMFSSLLASPFNPNHEGVTCCLLVELLRFHFLIHIVLLLSILGKSHLL